MEGHRGGMAVVVLLIVSWVVMVVGVVVMTWQDMLGVTHRCDCQQCQVVVNKKIKKKLAPHAAHGASSPTAACCSLLLLLSYM